MTYTVQTRSCSCYDVFHGVCALLFILWSSGTRHGVCVLFILKSVHYTDSGTVTDLTAVQTGFTTVCISWTAPSTAPSTRRYQVTVVSTPINGTVSGTSYIATLQPGNHTFTVRALTQHYPSMETSVDVTVTGKPRL